MGVSGHPHRKGLVKVLRNCIHCDYLEHTSPYQVFWRCNWWCNPNNSKGWADRYVWSMCHRQPEAQACQFFKPYQGERIGDVRADAICFRAATA